MKKVKVLSVMLWVVLSMAAATYVSCKGNKLPEETVITIADTVQVDTTVVDTTK